MRLLWLAFLAIVASVVASDCPLAECGKSAFDGLSSTCNTPQCYCADCAVLDRMFCAVMRSCTDSQARSDSTAHIVQLCAAVNQKPIQVPSGEQCNVGTGNTMTTSTTLQSPVYVVTTPGSAVTDMVHSGTSTPLPSTIVTASSSPSTTITTILVNPVPNQGGATTIIQASTVTVSGTAVSILTVTTTLTPSAIPVEAVKAVEDGRLTTGGKVGIGLAVGLSLLLGLLAVACCYLRRRRRRLHPNKPLPPVIIAGGSHSNDQDSEHDQGDAYKYLYGCGVKSYYGEKVDGGENDKADGIVIAEKEISTAYAQQSTKNDGHYHCSCMEHKPRKSEETGYYRPSEQCPRHGSVSTGTGMAKAATASTAGTSGGDSKRTQPASDAIDVISDTAGTVDRTSMYSAHHQTFNQNTHRPSTSQQQYSNVTTATSSDRQIQSRGDAQSYPAQQMLSPSTSHFSGIMNHRPSAGYHEANAMKSGGGNASDIPDYHLTTTSDPPWVNLGWRSSSGFGHVSGQSGMSNTVSKSSDGDSDVSDERDVLERTMRSLFTSIHDQQGRDSRPNPANKMESMTRNPFDDQNVYSPLHINGAKSNVDSGSVG